MLRTTRLLCAALAMSALAACGPGTDPNLEALGELETAFAALADARTALEAKRSELSNLGAASAEGAEGETAEGETAEVDPAAAEALTNAINAQADDFAGQVVAVINQAIDLESATEGTELAATVAEVKGNAIRFKSDEDMLIAQEFIDRGGNYRQAIEIYQRALEFDPEYQGLQDALAQAESDRYMSQERFASVKKGMTEDEVRELLGRPLHENVRDYPERNAVAWFFPKGNDGAAAAVWFQSKRGGPLETYKVDFNAIEGRSAPGQDG